MRIIYNDVDISSEVNIRSAVMRDRSGGALDDLTVTFDESFARWMRWTPSPLDTVELAEGAYTTGRMWVSPLRAEDGAFTLHAVSAPYTLRTPKWEAYDDISLAELLLRCAKSAGMNYKTYGLKENHRYPRIVRANETYAECAARVMEREGMTLKITGGAILAIDKAWADAAPHQRAYTIDKNTRLTYENNAWRSVHSVTIKTGTLAYTAYGKSAGADLIARNEMVFSASQAQRWANGILRSANEKNERLRLAVALDTSVAAMTRVSLDGLPMIEGEWIADDVTHAIQPSKKETVLTLRRVYDP